MNITPEEIEQIVRDYFTLPEEFFLKKYPSVNESVYWNGENGEGLVQALKAQLNKGVCPDLEEEIRTVILPLSPYKDRRERAIARILRACQGTGKELKFNNVLEADAHNWDTRELTGKEGKE